LIDGFYRLLAALGYTHPLHLGFVCVIVGLVAGAFLFSLGDLVWKKANLRTSAGHALVLAFVFVFPAVLFGVFDWMYFYDAARSSPVRIKMILSLAVFLLLAAGIILRGEPKIKSGVMVGIYAAALAGTMGLSFFGAELVSAGTGAAPTAENAPAPGAESAAAPAAESASAGTADDLRAGAVIFASNCQGCHPGGGNLVVAGLPLKQAQQLGSFETFVTFVHDPRMPDGSRGPMPAFASEQLSDAQARRLYAYIRFMMDDPAWK
jgi:mono/diheme cytochrome c family protein